MLLPIVNGLVKQQLRLTNCGGIAGEGNTAASILMERALTRLEKACPSPGEGDHVHRWLDYVCKTAEAMPLCISSYRIWNPILVGIVDKHDCAIVLPA